MTKGKNKVLSTRLDNIEARHIELMAKSEGISVSEYLRGLVMEDLIESRFLLMQKQLENIRAKKNKNRQKTAILNH
jgi:hypothetical protein